VDNKQNINTTTLKHEHWGNTNPPYVNTYNKANTISKTGVTQIMGVKTFIVEVF
jgi:hypothetical protein